MKNKLSWLAGPYVLWMTLVVIVPILLVVVYAFTASGGKRVTALVRNRLLRGTFCSTSGAAQSLVTLQRPFPVM